MTLRELIDRCGKNEADAWARLWEIASGAALFPIRRLLQHNGIGLELADDVMQEFYIYLLERDMEHLRAFRGESMAQFRVYVRTLAVHFTLNALRKIRRMQRQEARAAQDAPPPDRTGPTEEQFKSMKKELEELMTDKDRRRLLEILRVEKLDEVAVPSKESDPRSHRTYRRWKTELYRRYGRRVI